MMNVRVHPSAKEGGWRVRRSSRVVRRAGTTCTHATLSALFLRRPLPLVHRELPRLALLRHPPHAVRVVPVLQFYVQLRRLRLARVSKNKRRASRQRDQISLRLGRVVRRAERLLERPRERAAADAVLALYFHLQRGLVALAAAQADEVVFHRRRVSQRLGFFQPGAGAGRGRVRAWIGFGVSLPRVPATLARELRDPLAHARGRRREPIRAGALRGGDDGRRRRVAAVPPRTAARRPHRLRVGQRAAAAAVERREAVHAGRDRAE
eukprot:25973-Pelagococcus_subviridis.AAC.4